MGIKGAVLGDIAGSLFEFTANRDSLTDHYKIFNKDCFFTDDTVLTLATKYAILNNPVEPDFNLAYKDFGLKYPEKGYGLKFADWLYSGQNQPYGSAGNGSAMRVSYIGEYYNSLKEVQHYAIESAKITHNTKSGLLGAIATAGSVYLAKTYSDKELLMKYWKTFYNNSKNTNFLIETPLEKMKKNYKWTELCKDSVPLALRCVYESNSFEDFILNVLSFNCDTDTICAIGGGIAEELFGFKNLEVNKILKEYLDTYLYDLIQKT